MAKRKIKEITKEDIKVLSYAIWIQRLTDKLVDDGFAYCLMRDLNENGFLTRFVSLDDLGFISVNFPDFVEENQIEAVIKYANANL